MSAGLLDQVRASSGTASNVFELAMRESWLNRKTIASGWNSFFKPVLGDTRIVGAGVDTGGVTATSGDRAVC